MELVNEVLGEGGDERGERRLQALGVKLFNKMERRATTRQQPRPR